MSCKPTRERLYEFLDSQLSADLDTEVREHLAVCETCRSRVEHQRAFLDRLRRVELPTASEELRERVRSAFQTRHG